MWGDHRAEIAVAGIHALLLRLLLLVAHRTRMKERARFKITDDESEVYGKDLDPRY